MDSRAPLSTSAAPSLLLLAGLLLVAAGSARASLVVSCEWPPPGGPSVMPNSTDVMMTPMVGDLDGDGLPEIVIVTFTDVNDNNRGEDGVLRVLSGADCSEIVTVVDPGPVRCFGDAVDRSLEERDDPGVFCPGCGVAIADLDDDGDMEIVLLAEGQNRPVGGDPDDFTVGFPRRIVILDHLGAFVSCSEGSPYWLGQVAAPTLADLDADGSPEIVARGAAWNLDGSQRWARPPHGLGPSVVADLDDDGLQEVVVGEAAYREDGSLFWLQEDLRSGFAAVGDMNLDCIPEVVFTANKFAAVMVLDGLTGTPLASAGLPGGLDICPLPGPSQGGAPTLADVDGDLIPEIGVAGCLNYSVFKVVLDAANQVIGLNLLWTQPIEDDSSRITASTFFDLEGDGRIETLYQDHSRLWVYDAMTGAVVDTFDHSNSTLIEYPAVADVDADGQAEIVIVGNDYFRCCDVGIKVLHDPAQPWTPTRPLLNQHAYHQTNIEDDGTIPIHEEPSWSRNNNYRAQLVPSTPLRQDCGPPPELVCDPQGPYGADCALNPDCPGGVEVLLEAADNPLGMPGPVSYTWTLDCAGEVQVLMGRTVAACVPVTCSGCTISLEVSLPGFLGSECETELEWTFGEPPLQIDAGPDATADCSDPPDPVPPIVLSACGSPPAPDFERIRIDGACPGNYLLVDRWFAIDACGTLVEDERTIEVTDTTAPVLDPVPPDLDLDCGETAPLPVIAASDDCGAAPVVFEEVRIDGRCPDSYQLLRTWTAADACGNSASDRQVISYDDLTAPTLSGVPGDQTLPCGPVPPPVSPTVSDLCDPDPQLLFEEVIVPGPCPQSFDVVRTWTATDRCGNVSEESRTLFIRDLEPPMLTVPAPLVLECEGGGGFSVDDPRIQDWLAAASATDDCTDPVVVTWDAPDFFPVGCPDPAPLLVTFFAEDDCGNAVSGSSTISVVDTTPPEILALDLPGCLWSPNHMYACFPDVSEFVTAVDACSGGVTVRVQGCSSDQPDEAPEDGDRGGREHGNGDGHTFNDCLVAPDGSGVCARFERQGTDGNGRHYAMTIVVSDDCGNSVPVPWDLWVPHDQREHPCPNAKRPAKLGPNDPFPWED